MTTIQIAKNAVVAKLIDPPEKAASFVNSLLSYHVESSGFGSWSGKSSFYSVNRGTFPAGFAHVVQSELTKIGYGVRFVAKAPPEPLGPESPIVDEFGNDNPDYDFQLKALRQVEKHSAGIIRVATGGGKSKISKLICARYRRMTLFLTTRGILLYQMKDQLDDINFNTGVIGDGEMNFVRGVNLGMVQTLVRALEIPSLDGEIRAVVKSIHGSKNKDSNMSRAEIEREGKARYDKKVQRREKIIKFLSMIEVVIGEEAHEAGGESYYEILRHCKNAQIRVALTATPFMRSSGEDNMRLMAAFGPVLIDVSEETLINRGILAKPYFKFRDVEPHKKLHKTSPFERAYKFGYTDNPHMHEALIRDARMAAERCMPILTLVARKAHGDQLLKTYRANGLKFEFLRGEDDMDNRKKQLELLATGEIDGVIGTTILDVGVDVPGIGLVQLAGGMKAQVALRQRVGRGLRRKKTMPNFAFIADYSCNFNATLRDHARMRHAIINRTSGFAEGIVAEDQDFPWNIFEVKRRL